MPEPTDKVSVPEVCEAPVFVGVLLPFGDKIMKECPRLKTAAPFAMISDLCCDVKSPINLKIAIGHKNYKQNVLYLLFFGRYSTKRSHFLLCGCIGPFTIKKSYADEVRRRALLFKEKERTSFGLNNTFVTTFGVADGVNKDVVDSEVTAEDLFR